MTETQLDTIAPQPAVTGVGIRRFYAFKLITEMQLTGGIWILYLQSKGLSLGEIGVSEAAFHLAPVLFELPSGSFADLVGRRWSMAIGALLIALSSMLLLFADTLPMAMAALFFNGASYSFRSGADQAYLYDSLGDRQATFGSILGKLMGASYIVGAITIWLGAALSEISYTWPIVLAAGAGLGGAWLATGLVEDRPLPAVNGERRSAVVHAREAVAALRARPDVIGVLLFAGGFWTAATIAFLYLQAAFGERGMSNSTIGLVLAGGMILTALGSAAAGRVEHRIRFSSQLGVLAALTGLGIAGTGAGATGIAVAAFLAANLTSGLLDPLMYAWYNRQLPSAQRATLISVDSWMFSLTMIVMFPLAGWASEQFGWGVVYLVCGLTQIMLTTALFALLWLRRVSDFAPEPG